MLKDAIRKAGDAYYGFIGRMQCSGNEYRFTPASESSPFALCFAVFGLHLLGKERELDLEDCARRMKSNLKEYYRQRCKVSDVNYDKPFLQLLTFSLSSLKAIGALEQDPLEEFVEPLLPGDIGHYLERSGSLNGMPQSGNLAMFMAILLIHARDYLQRDTQAHIERWVELHLNSMNQCGFWGNKRGMSYSQFQNGYHQYEIFEYLGITVPHGQRAVSNVAGLADTDGHFAPYPGGGGCYDYDAIFLITSAYNQSPEEYRSLLEKTAASLLREQNPDGGFAESHSIRPRTAGNLMKALTHVARSKGAYSRLESLRYVITLQRSKHNRIHTHWSTYSREWGESNLWDSWFRMLALARIECALWPDQAEGWRFIDYPGIGFHHQLHS